MEEEILHEGFMLGTVIYISEYQNKLAWKFGISVSHGKTYIVDLVLRHYHGASGCDTARFDAEIRMRAIEAWSSY